MCLIVVKPSGIDMPSRRKIRRWFYGHPDGAGLMYAAPGEQPHILKGAMQIKALLALIDSVPDVKDVDLVIHFRQATHGYISPANCHPFPISSDVRLYSQTDLVCDRAIAHNGIIPEDVPTSGRTGLTQTTTDTQRFVESRLVPLGELITDARIQTLIADATNSRFAMLDATGLTLIGTFIEDAGLWYSNAGYKRETFDYYGYAGSPYPYLDDTAYSAEYCDDCGKLCLDSELVKVDAYRLVCPDCRVSNLPSYWQTSARRYSLY